MAYTRRNQMRKSMTAKERSAYNAGVRAERRRWMDSDGMLLPENRMKFLLGWLTRSEGAAGTAGGLFGGSSAAAPDMRIWSSMTVSYTHLTLPTICSV